MPGENDLHMLLENMKPVLHEGDYVFSSVTDVKEIDMNSLIATFTEKEGTTVVLSKANADKLNLTYSFVCAWITLTVHSSLEAIGLTAAFSTALSKEGISCNVMAGYYHDHIFVNKRDAVRAMKTLSALTQS
jgi:hypothetical protein